MNMLDKAISLAVAIHSGQLDKQNSPYIIHPIHVMAQFKDPIYQMVAIMHDVIEDSHITFDDLRRMEFSETVITAIDHLTRRKKETYDDYITRVIKNKIALMVKIEDVSHNLEKSISGSNDLTVSEDVRKRMRLRILKYSSTKTRLMEAYYRNVRRKD